MIKSLIFSSPPNLNYVAIIVLPTRPKNMSSYEFISNQLQVYGLAQFLKIGIMYTYRKFIAARFSDAYSLTRVAKKNKTYLLRTSSLKDDNVKKALRSFSADVIVSVASTRIFDKEILSIPRLACINVHAGKLPKYRGVNPSFWALLNGEKESAITVHYMNESIDDGEIIQQDIFNISGITSLHKVYMKLLEIAPRTLVTSLIAIDKGTVKTKKNPSSSSYFSYPKKEDGRRFRSLGLKFI